MQSKESSHGSQSTQCGYRVERAVLFSDPDRPSDAASGVPDASPCPVLRRSGEVPGGAPEFVEDGQSGGASGLKLSGISSEPRVSGGGWEIWRRIGNLSPRTTQALAASGRGSAWNARRGLELRRVIEEMRRARKLASRAWFALAVGGWVVRVITHIHTVLGVTDVKKTGGTPAFVSLKR